MSNFTQAWAAQLRAAAQDVMDHADEITADIGPNVSLDVHIHLQTRDAIFQYPTLVITREVTAQKACHEMIAQYTGRATCVNGLIARQTGSDALQKP